MARVCEICSNFTEGMRYSKRAACFSCIDKALDFFIENKEE